MIALLRIFRLYLVERKLHKTIRKLAPLMEKHMALNPIKDNPSIHYESYVLFRNCILTQYGILVTWMKENAR